MGDFNLAVACLDRYTRGQVGGVAELSARGLGDDCPPLLQVPAARHWFSVLDTLCQESAYTFQVPLDRASSASSGCLSSDVVLFSTYSYLGLNTHPRIDKAAFEAVKRYGTSAGGARLLTGTLDLHLELEAEVAEFMGQPAAAVYASGYDANVAVITALFSASDLVLMDQYAHRSLQDGVQMAGCELKRFRHNRLDRLENMLARARAADPKRRILVVVDGVYSMEGDQVPLRELVEIKDRYGAFLLVDEAHSIGTIGATGRGVCEAQNVPPSRVDIVTGSLAKAIPSSGGFVAGSRDLKLYLQYGSSPYFFSAATTPANTAAALEAFRVIRSEPEHLRRLHDNVSRLRAGLEELGLPITATESPVVPVVLGDERRTFRWAAELFRAGVTTSAVVHPAVPAGQARLRLCATSAHRDEHFERLFAGLRACLASEA